MEMPSDPPENPIDHSPLFKSRLLFNYIGISSVVPLCFILLQLMLAVMSGDYTYFTGFFQRYPGSEPFVIFVLPVIVIAGSGWIYKQFSIWKQKRQ